MSYFGTPALQLNPSMGFVPVRRLISLLSPVDQRCFITPVEKPWHRLSMGTGEHKRFHGRFRVPHRSSPKRHVAVAQERDPEIASSALSLPRRADSEKRNGTRNRHERTRKRVTETTGMSHIRSCFGFELGEFSSRLNAR